MRKLITTLAVLAIAGIANAATYVTNYVSDGQFESPAGDYGPWGNQFGPDAISFLVTGGNPGGCAQVDDTVPNGGWGGFAYVNPPTDAPLAALGLTAGQNYTFVMDMKIVSGIGIGGLKVESWTDTANIGYTQTYPTSGSSSWATYTFNCPISPGATFLNIVPVWGPGSVVQYDNIGVVVRLPDPLTVSITSPANSQVVYSSFSVNAAASVFPATVANVAFYLDGTLQGSDTSSPFRYAATGVSVGTHTLSAVATDSNGNTATSSVVHIIVTNTAIPAASITLDAASSGSTGNAAASSCTWSHTVGSGVNRMLVVGISAESTTVPAIASVTYGGVALTHVPGGRALSGSTYDTADQWYLMAPAVGTANIVVTFSTTLAGWPSTGGAACGAVSLFGVTQDAPEAVAINNTGTTATNSIATSITTLTPGAWLVDVVNNGNGSSSFSGAPGTRQWDLPASTSYAICSGGGATVTVPTAGLVTDTWTYGAFSRMAQSIAAFSPATPVLLSTSAAITSPTNGALVSTTSFSISADASVSPGTVTNVNFYVDGSLVGNDTSSPFSHTVSGASAGAHALKIVAKDSNGNSVTSAVVNVTAQNFAPSVALTSPADGSAVLVGASVPLAATASDDGTVTSVGFYVDGSLIGSDATSPYNATWASATLGTHALTAVAHDNGGLSTTSAVVTITCLTTFAAYESFNYGALPNGTTNTAQGLTGYWTCVPAPSLVAGLAYADLPTAGNAMSSSGGRQFANFAAPLSSGTEWISFLCSQTGDPGAVKNGVYFPNGGTGLFFGFGLGAATATQGAMGLGSMNTAGAGNQDATRLSTSPSLQTYGTTYLVVLRIDFNTSGNNDTVTVYINPPVHASAPGVAADQTVSSFDVGTITGVGLNVGNTAFTVDEIRRGSTYPEVGGGVYTPTVPTTLALSIGATKQVSWSANSTSYYQPQKSDNNSTWSDLGGLFFGSAVTSIYDPAPAAYYQVLEIAPAAQEQIADGGFEVDGGIVGNHDTAFYWTGSGSQAPARITSDFHNGTACMSVFVTNAEVTANTCFLQQKLSYAGGGTIVGGNTYSFSFWAKSLGRNPAGGYVQQYRVAWLNSSGAVVGSVSAGFTGGNGTWAQISSGPVVAPASAVDASIEVSGVTGGFAGDFGGVLVDDMSLSSLSPGGVSQVLSPTVRDGQAFMAAVQSDGVTATAASGTVHFTTNGVAQSIKTVASGVAVSDPTTAMPASYTVTATYSGDAIYMGSTAILTVGTTVATNPTNITFRVTGSTLRLSWPADHLGWIMQSNSVDLVNTNYWFNVPDSQNGTSLDVTLDAAKPKVFFRLRNP